MPHTVGNVNFNTAKTIGIEWMGMSAPETNNARLENSATTGPTDLYTNANPVRANPMPAVPIRVRRMMSQESGVSGSGSLRMVVRRRARTAVSPHHHHSQQVNADGKWQEAADFIQNGNAL